MHVLPGQSDEAEAELRWFWERVAAPFVSVYGADSARTLRRLQPIDFLRFMDELVFIKATIYANTRMSRPRVSDAEFVAQLEANVQFEGAAFGVSSRARADVLARSFNVYYLFLALCKGAQTEQPHRRRRGRVQARSSLLELRNHAAWRGIAPSYDWVIPPPICDEEQFRREVASIERRLTKDKDSPCS